MIETLNGIHETVAYYGDFKLRIYPNREYEDYPQHWHTEIEIIMPIENNYKVVVNEKTYILEEGDILIIPPGVLHQLYAPPSGYRIILQFDFTLLYSLNCFNSAFQMFRSCVNITPSSMPDTHKELSTLVRDINSEYFSELPFREALVYSMLIRFFTILGRKFISSNEGFSNIKIKKRHEYVDSFFNVCNYIDAHCTDDIKIDDIAEVAGFSKYHFARLFKEVMNISCYDYLIRCRIIYAEKLLIEPDLSITQVAMRSGFSSLATFNRVFKAKNHCTPKEYKSLYKIN